MNEIANRVTGEITEAPVVTAEQTDLIIRTIAKDATPDELQLFLYDCKRQGVHPLDKLLHFTKRKGKYTPITSIDLMRTRAADTGEYAGSDDAVFHGNPIESATVTIYRFTQRQRCQFTATARWSEYYPGKDSGFMWDKMPHTMLAKCAEALALRKAFPRQLAGLYAKEEMDQAESCEPKATRSHSVAQQPKEREVQTSEPVKTKTEIALENSINSILNATAEELVEKKRLWAEMTPESKAKLSEGTIEAYENAFSKRAAEDAEFTDLLDAPNAPKEKLPESSDEEELLTADQFKEMVETATTIPAHDECVKYYQDHPQAFKGKRIEISKLLNAQAKTIRTGVKHD